MVRTFIMKSFEYTEHVDAALMRRSLIRLYVIAVMHNLLRCQLQCSELIGWTKTAVQVAKVQC